MPPPLKTSVLHCLPCKRSPTERYAFTYQFSIRSVHLVCGYPVLPVELVDFCFFFIVLYHTMRLTELFVVDLESLIFFLSLHAQKLA